MRVKLLMVLSGLALVAICTAPIARAFPDGPTGMTGPQRSWRLVKVAPTTTARPTISFEDPGKLLVVTDGPLCGESFARSGEVVALAGSFTLPDFADRGTVFLNGWSLRYLESDHEVKEVGAVIKDISLDGKAPKWTAAGTIEDHNSDDPYEFCYVYTVLAWSHGAVDAVADHRDLGGEFYNRVSANGSTALVTLSSYRELPSSRPSLLPPPDTVAILPRGFRFRFEGEHHVLQLAVNIDHGERFLEAGKVYGDLLLPVGGVPVSRIDPSVVSWDTAGIIKDNALAREYTFEEQVSTLRGSGLSIVRPAYSIAPGRSPGLFGACIGNPGPAGIKRRDVEIHNLAFDYALPVLSGWDLDFGCGDNHVTHAGVWLENIRYRRNPSDAAVLQYTVASVLRDKDSDPAHAFTHKVDVIGLDGTEPTDLIPQAAQLQFCDRDPAGHLLITVANVGDDDARPSTTRVDFKTRFFELDTPAVKKGSVVVVIGPIGCPGGDPADCDFRLTVDANGDVAETNEANNTAQGLCIN